MDAYGELLKVIYTEDPKERIDGFHTWSNRWLVRLEHRRAVPFTPPGSKDPEREAQFEEHLKREVTKELIENVKESIAWRELPCEWSAFSKVLRGSIMVVRSKPKEV